MCDLVHSVIFQAVVKALEGLAEQGKIREKTYGKQKVYVADQVSINTRFVGALVTVGPVAC